MDAFASHRIRPENRVVTISESAVTRLNEIFTAESRQNLMLRVTVSGGGCSGYQYGFDFADSSEEEDSIFERDGVKIVVDDASLDLLAGSEIDYAVELVGAAFQVKNPNASSSCGCGTSFSL